MLRLPARFAAVILCFAPLFRQHTWRHAEVLLLGAILVPGQRTVTSILRRCCTDPAGGAAGRAGVAGRPLTCPPDAQRALQAEPGPSPPYPHAEAQGDELARIRRWPTPARELDGVVHR